MFINKKIKFYGIFKKEDAKAVLQGKKKLQDVCCYSIVNTLKEAAEFMIRLSVANSGEHYLSWCGIHDLEPSNQTAINLYFHDVVEDKDAFSALAIKYDLSKIAAILRIFNRCVPLGCSYDLDIEHITYNTLKQQEKTNNG